MIFWCPKGHPMPFPGRKPVAGRRQAFPLLLRASPTRPVPEGSVSQPRVTWNGWAPPSSAGFNQTHCTGSQVPTCLSVRRCWDCLLCLPLVSQSQAEDRCWLLRSQQAHHVHRVPTSTHLTDEDTSPRMETPVQVHRASQQPSP